VASVLVAGSVAQRPGRGGHAWVFLSYLLGMRRLGHEVHFLDRLTTEMAGVPAAGLEGSPQARWLRRTMESFGLGEDYTLIVGPRSRSAALERLRGADLLLDVNGFLDDPELLDAAAVSAFVDIDPAIQQMWQALGLAEMFGRHDLHFTVGENIGRGGCAVPTCGVEWIATRPPVVLDQWQGGPAGERFTSVASWRGPYGSIEYEGETYGLRAHELRRLLDLPGRVGAELALALDIDPEDEADAAALREAGWGLLDPAAVAGDPGAYRDFVQGSGAELNVAKNVYVRSRCGWFSDRSASYLASGRPVLAQDTGYPDNLPTGEGLLRFDGLEEAAAGIEEIRRDWPRHRAAARRLAVEHFDSDRVLGEMLDAAAV